MQRVGRIRDIVFAHEHRLLVRPFLDCLRFAIIFVYRKNTPHIRVKIAPMKILDIVDMQYDFMMPDGALAVPGADALIDRVNDLFTRLPRHTYDFALFKYDSHFASEYPHSPEAQSFPDIHCEYGTKGWQLVVDYHRLEDKCPVYFMAKNTFDMWGRNPVSAGQDLDFRSEEERRVYANLHHISDDPTCLKPGVHRDTCLRDVGSSTHVVMIGVASNFCVYDAMRGYLQRGAQVTVLEDCVAGIPLDEQTRQSLINETGCDRTSTGNIRDVVRTPRFASYYDSGQLVLSRAEDYVAVAS